MMEKLVCVLVGNVLERSLLKGARKEGDCRERGCVQRLSAGLASAQSQDGSEDAASLGLCNPSVQGPSGLRFQHLSQSAGSGLQGTQAGCGLRKEGGLRAWG